MTELEQAIAAMVKQAVDTRQTILDNRLKKNPPGKCMPK